MTYTDSGYPATVSDFRLDTYEVTVGRFRRFVAAYSPSMIPAGAGKNPHDPSDAGWDSIWNGQMPPDIKENVSCPWLSWTDTPGANENLPINCLVSWYVASAFCIWDGGRLPTEAEWNYAAAGGPEQRAYPWSSPPNSTAIDCSYANYRGALVGIDKTCVTTLPFLNAVGSESPKGDGRWGQADLAGNVAEWTLDVYAAPYAQVSCGDCSNQTFGTPGVGRVLRGGEGLSNSPQVLSSYRAYDIGSGDLMGVRCARSP